MWAIFIFRVLIDRVFRHVCVCMNSSFMWRIQVFFEDTEELGNDLFCDGSGMNDEK